MNILNKGWVIAVLAIILAGCAATAPKDPMERQQLLEQRVAERWEYLLAKDFFEAWEYLSPGHRKVVSAESYARRLSISHVVWKEAEMVDLTCESAEVCRVSIALTVEVETGMPAARKVISRQVSAESWIWTENNWFYVPRS